MSFERDQRLGLSVVALALGAMCVLGAVIRTWRLAAVPFRDDEAFSWRVAGRPVANLLRCVAADTHPPGHFLILKAWIAVFGDSPLALRSSSVIAGVLSIPAVYALTRLSIRVANARKEHTASNQYAALFSASIVCTHLSQVEPARFARMYSLAALFASISALLLLMAMRARRGVSAHWAVYGAAAAAFLYCHNFALFAIAGQWLLVLGWLSRIAQLSHRRLFAASARGFAVAIGTCVVLYSPWLPALLAQANRVRDGFWIPPATWNEMAALFATCISGVAATSSERVYVGLLIALMALYIAVARPSGAGIFFLVQWALPWLATALISTLGERPLMQERYMTSAQIAFAALCGAVLYQLPHPCARAGLASLVLGCAVFGTCDRLAALPTTPPPIAAAAAWISAAFRPGDVVHVEPAAQVNLLRYYGARAGNPNLDVRCRVSPFRGRGQIAHASSLDRADALWDSAKPPVSVERLWRGPGGASPPTGWRLVTRRVFGNEGGASPATYSLELYSRPTNDRHSPARPD